MIVPITVLAFGAIFLGYMFKDLMIGAGSSFLTISLGSTFAHHNLIDSEFLPTSIKLVPLVLSLSGAALALVLYRQEPALAVNLKTGFSRIFAFLTHSWYIDALISRFISRKVLNFGYKYSFQLLDKGLFESVGPKNASNVFYQLSQSISQLQTGIIYHSVFSMVLGLVVILALV